MSRAGEVNDLLRQRRADWLPQVFPKGRRRSGYFYIGNANGEPGESLKIPLNPNKPGLRDFGNCWKGDDLGLLAEGLGVEVGEALRHAEGMLGIAAAPAPQRRTRPRASTPPPRTAPTRPNGPAVEPGVPPTRHPQLGESTYPAWYYDPGGRLIMGHHRFDRPDGKKEFRPVHPADGRWRWADPPGLLPLYNLPDLAAHPEKPVLLVEGERAADHARDLLPDDVVMTWPHGAEAVAKVDWSPLRDRDVVLWPDHGDAGAAAMKAAAEALLAVGARSVRRVELPADLPHKWDLADPLPDDWDIDHVELLIGIAVDVRAERLAGLGITNAADLVRRELSEPRFIVPGYVTAGVNVLAGRPKIGKSWAALGVACGVAAGGAVMGSVPVDAGDVLYLGLEDNERRLQGRLRAVLQGDPASPRLHLATSWRRLDDGGLDDLRLWLEVHPEARLVIIDTFAKVRGRGDRDAGLYANDYNSVAGLKALADRHDVAVLLVHHLRKAAADDPLDEVSGSTGLTGAVDTVLVLKRERSRADAILHVTGRDVPEAEKALSFDKDTGRWTLIGEADEYRRSQEQTAILRALSDRRMTPKELAEELGKQRGAVRFLLSKMAKQGLVKADDAGRYGPADAAAAG